MRYLPGVGRFDTEGWWCEDGHKLPWNHQFCVANSRVRRRSDVIGELQEALSAALDALEKKG